jgi:hypothetical protein
MTKKGQGKKEMDKRLHMSVLRSLVDSTDPREQVAGRPPQLSPKTAAEE